MRFVSGGGTGLTQRSKGAKGRKLGATVGYVQRSSVQPSSDTYDSPSTIHCVRTVQKKEPRNIPGLPCLTQRRKEDRQGRGGPMSHAKAQRRKGRKLGATVGYVQRSPVQPSSGTYDSPSTIYCVRTVQKKGPRNIPWRPCLTQRRKGDRQVIN
jgi:hypothetical protein